MISVLCTMNDNHIFTYMFCYHSCVNRFSKSHAEQSETMTSIELLKFPVVVTKNLLPHKPLLCMAVLFLWLNQA